MPPTFSKSPKNDKAVDLALVKQVQDGNKSAFNILVRTHQRAVYSMVFSMVKDHDTTDDIVQDSFVKAYNNIQGFEARSSFKSWLYSIAINTAKNTLKASSMRNTVDHEKVVLEAPAVSSENIEQQELQTVLAQEIDKLPKKQKMVLILRIFDELPFKEIANIMECPYDTAKANFRHAINSLRKQSRILGVA